MPASFEAKPEAAAQRARGARSLVGHLPRIRFETEHRDHAFFLLETALDVQRLPRAALLVLREAGRELADSAQRRALDVAGLRATDVAQRQLHRAANGRVGAVAVTERHHAHIHADAFANRAVDDDD